ncbi:hypothetical protein LMIY3S_05630 [Labrys miyagiensis]
MTETPPAVAIRAVLERIRSSEVFSGSERLCAFLLFIVEETLAGRGASLKEAVIGNEVYRRGPAYDPRIDSAVRVEARRLRRKLEDYYRDEGAGDEVRIDLPTGRYTPDFHWQAGLAASKAPEPALQEEMFPEGRGAAIAVLPFRALSQDPVDESFADGLTDELIYALSREEGMHVASRGATLHGIASQKSLADIASELGIDALIQGTVRRVAGRLRVTIEVSSARGFVVWSDRFDTPDEDLLDFEEKIAATTLNRLRLDSSRMRANQIRPGPQALAAFAGIVRGRLFLDRQTPESLGRAMAMFQQVARTAPDYARGYSGIADCACDMYRLGLIGRDEAAGQARRAATQAIALDPSSVEAHASLATVAAWLDFDKVQAEASFTTSIGLGENARARRIFGAFLTILERHGEAESMFRQARNIEPISSQQDITEAVCHFQSRRFALLLERSGASARELPLEAAFHLALADIFGGNGRLAAEITGSWSDTAAAAFPALALAQAELEALASRPQRAEHLLARRPPATRFATATLAAAIGDESRAFAALEATVAERELDRAWIRTDARLDRLRNTPRFDQLMALHLESIGANR